MIIFRVYTIYKNSIEGMGYSVPMIANLLCSVLFLYMVLGTGIMSMAYSLIAKNNSEIIYSLYSSTNSCSVPHLTTGDCKHTLCILTEEYPLQERVELGRLMYSYSDIITIPLSNIHTTINNIYLI